MEGRKHGARTKGRREIDAKGRRAELELPNGQIQRLTHTHGCANDAGLLKKVGPGAA